MSLGPHLGALGRVLEPQRGSLGGPKRLRELNLEGQSALRGHLGGPKLVEEPNLESRKPSEGLPRAPGASRLWKHQAFEEPNLLMIRATRSKSIDKT